MKLTSKIALLTLVTACASSVEMNKNLMDMEPADAISTAQQRMEEARVSQAELFSKDYFEEGQDHLREAREELDEKDNEEAIEHAAYADAYFQKAITNAKKSDKKYTPVLNAREAATNATNIYGVKPLANKLQDIDDEFIDSTDGFTKKITPQETAAFQEQYLELEADAVEYKNLHLIKEAINKEEKRNADELASKTFNKAEQSYLFAKNLVRQNPREPQAYTPAVLKAREDALMLRDVMKVIKSEKKPTPEKVAITQVLNNRKLAKAENRIGLYQDTLAMAGEELQDRNSKLNNLEDKVSFQQAMERMRNTFDPNEAEVYQQGNKLIVRLKQIGFGVGSAKIPAKSEELLKKITSMIEDIDAKSIQVQGHTDTTGSEKINQNLSEKRAKQVARFMQKQGVQTPLESKGFASEMPITNNLTAKNRSLNRRVDVVITAQGPESTYAE